MDSGTTGDVNIGTGINAKTINIGTGTAGNIINIGSDNTTADTITIGSLQDNISITADDWNITNAGAANFVSIGVATPGSGAFTSLSSTGITALGNDTSTVAINSNTWDVTAAGVVSGITGYTQSEGNFTVNGSGDVSLGTGTGNVSIGNGTGTFEITSNGGINVSTAGVITLPGGQAADITTSGATALTIAPGGAAELTLGSNATTAINLTTDATGDAELVLPDQSVSASEILNNTITTTQLASTLTFSDGDFIDLSAVDHSTSDPQGLLLPNTNTPVNPASGVGYLAYDADIGKIVFYDGTIWDTLASGASSSKWTENAGNNILYPNNVGRNLSLNSTLVSAFSVDYANNTARVGSGSATNATISMYASDGDTGSLIYNTSDQFQFSGGDVAIDNDLLCHRGNKRLLPL